MIKIANAPCSWGVLEFDLEGKAAGYAQVLDEMVETGYAGHRTGRLGLYAHRSGAAAAGDPWPRPDPAGRICAGDAQRPVGPRCRD